MNFEPVFGGYETKVRRSFSAQSMMETFGAQLTKVAPGSVEITSCIGDHVRQQMGFAHGGLAFSLGDSAAGFAALTLQHENTEVVTVEMKINYLAPAVGDQLIAIGKVLKAGRRTCTVTADVFIKNEKGGTKQVAALMGTMFCVDA